MRTFLIGVLVVSLVGCAQTREDATLEIAKSIALKVVDKAKLDQSAMQASGSIVNPEYRYTFFGGMGVGSWGSVQAVGVDVNAGVQASGLGEGAPDQDLRVRLNEILMHKELSQQARRDKILEAVIRWMESKAVAEAPPTTQPSP